MEPRLRILAIMTLGAAMLLARSASATWQSFTASSGLGTNSVSALFEDRSGNLWVQGNDIARYDGVTWTHYPGWFGPKSPVEDVEGNIWFGGGGPGAGIAAGVHRFDGHEMRTLGRADGLASDTANVILAGRSGGVWIGSPVGLSHWTGSRWDVFRTEDGLGSNDVGTLLEDRHGALWVGSPTGLLSRYDGANWTTYGTDTDFEGWAFVIAMHEMRGGDLWFATVNGGITRFDGSTWQKFPIFPTGSYETHPFVEDSTGGLWATDPTFHLARFARGSWTSFTAGSPDEVGAILFAEGDGVWFTFGYPCRLAHFDGEEFHTVPPIDGAYACEPAEVDRAGNLWSGSYDGGVSRWNGKNWLSYDQSDGLVGYRIAAILEDHVGNMWFAAQEGGLSRYDQSGWRPAESPFGRAFGGGYVDHSGRMWFNWLDSRRHALIYSGASDSAAVAAEWDTLEIPAPHEGAYPVLQDHTGAYWFGGAGAARWDGAASWTFYSASNGFTDDPVLAIEEDSQHGMWFGTEYSGVFRFENGAWSTLTTADGLPSNGINDLFEDRDHRMWIGHDGGVSVWDDGQLTTYTTADGLPYDRVYTIVQDRDGAMWFGTNDGLSRFDGATWRTFRASDGLVQEQVYALILDHNGHVWAGANGGVSEYADGRWHSWTDADGLDGAQVDAVSESPDGEIWVGGLSFRSSSETAYVTSIYSRDRTAPRAVVVSAPPAVSSSRIQNAVFLPAYGEGLVEFGTALDDGAWSSWSLLNTWNERDLPDGVHTLAVQARDRYGNQDPTPRVVTFEIDATPPIPRFDVPTAGQPVQGVVTVSGSADDPRFAHWTLHVRGPGPVQPLDSLIAESSAPVPGGTLASLDTRNLDDGPYELILAVRDTLGLTGVAEVGFTVDNLPPFANVTAPVVLDAVNGGDIYTTDARVHLYFPPRALDRDTEVRIDSTASDGPRPQLADGATQITDAWQVSWQGTPLAKPITLGVASTSTAPGAALYVQPAGGAWTRVGGSRDGAYLSAPVTLEGLYAVFGGGVAPGLGAALSAISLTPRAFSPRGNFASTDVAIGFTLGRAGPATIRIYNRAGRLVQLVANNVSFGAGANLVRWNGRDRAGATVVDGLYLVSIEAFGERHTETLAVVR